VIIRRLTRFRKGATTVEVAVVLSVFLMFLFGVFEYCRYLLMVHVTTNAARDAARYAVVNITRPANFDVQAHQDASGRIHPSIVEFTRIKLSGVDRMIVSPTQTNYFTHTGTNAGHTLCRVEVFPCNPDNLNSNPPNVTPKVGAASWNDAEFGQRIAIRITGNYRPVLPNFLLMGHTIPVNVTVTMGSEG
jgi:Flp pilus assembly protein TadG